MDTNVLYYGDNLDILRRFIPAESVDLVYLDPPFNSNRTYSAIFADESGRKSDAQIHAFEDSWHWGPTPEAHLAYLKNSTLHQGKVPVGVSQLLAALEFGIGKTPMLAYLVEMAVRLIELHRVLKPTGSLYLHCDPTASHYLKIVLDAIFGPANFVVEIIWRRTNARGTTGRWPRVHDVILHFNRSGAATFNAIRELADPARMPHTLIAGSDGLSYQTYELTAQGASAGDSGRPWRGFDPGIYGRHWANTHEQMEAQDGAGLIHWPRNGGWPRRLAAVPFMAAAREVVVGDVWNDIDRINQTAKERLGYPTQKPVALLERIVAASSNPGDIVLDPFCGCGTALVAAQKLGRRWIGIDITYLAVGVMRRRLQDSFPDLPPIHVEGEPTEVEGARLLATQLPEGRYQFQWWALDEIGALPASGDHKKGSDTGIDGRITFTGADGGLLQALVSVKSGKPKADDVRVLKSVCEREGAAIGIIVTLDEPTKPMRHEATIAGTYHSDVSGKDYPRIQILSVADLLERGLRPQLPPLVSAPLQRAGKVTARVDQATLFGERG
jgi:DNA modification methylase